MLLVKKKKILFIGVLSAFFCQMTKNHVTIVMKAFFLSLSETKPELFALD